MKPLSKIFLILAVCFLAACNHVNDAQLKTASNRQLCDRLDAGWSYDEVSKQRLQSFVAAKRINCDPEHIACEEYGYKPGTSNYSNCRLEVRRMAAAERAQEERLALTKQAQEIQQQQFLSQQISENQRQFSNYISQAATAPNNGYPRGINRRASTTCAYRPVVPQGCRANQGICVCQDDQCSWVFQQCGY